MVLYLDREFKMLVKLMRCYSTSYLMNYFLTMFIFGSLSMILIPDVTAQYIGNVSTNASDSELEEQLGTSVSKFHQISAEKKEYEQQSMLIVSLSVLSFVISYAIYRAFRHNKKGN